MPSRQDSSSQLNLRRSLRIRQAVDRAGLSNDDDNVSSDSKTPMESSIPMPTSKPTKKRNRGATTTRSSKNTKRKIATSSKVSVTKEIKNKDHSSSSRKRGSKVLASTQSPRSVNNTDSDQDDKYLLLDLGKLIKGRLVKRPSASVRSPYVSDVMILNEKDDDNDEDDGGEEKETPTVLAHSPALDVGGLCAPGAIVYMSERPPGGKTSHSIELLLAPAPNKAIVTSEEDGVLVGCHPRLGEKLAEEVLKKGLLEDVIGYGPAQLNTQRKRTARTASSKKKMKRKNKYDDDNYGDDSSQQGIILTTQCQYGDSRVDFELVDHSTTPDEAGQTRSLIEVKNVICSDVAAKFAPDKTGPNHCVIIAENGDAEEYKRTGIFPWGRVGQEFEGKKVVSERAIKHLRNLSELVSNDPQIKSAVVMFVINRSDCQMMRACDEACPMFASELRAAADNGCTVLSFRVRWTIDGKAYFDGIVPVNL